MAFSSYSKALSKITAQQLSLVKSQLLGKSWKINDESLSAYKARQLYITLHSALEGKNTNSSTLPTFSKGSPIPYGYSLIYCNPIHYESDLSPDGYDDFNSPTLNNVDYFNRRMWVGGEFLFDPENPLRFGDNVQFEETVERVKSLNHNETIFVDYNRRYVNEAGLSQVEKRRICYLYGLYGEEEPAALTDTIQPDEYRWITLSKVTNFRMSALTFNSHLLHYDENYCKGVEGYPKVVVQAPLLFEIALQFWLDRAGKGKDVKRIKYKVSRPVFVDQQVKVCFKEIDGGKWKLWLEDRGGETLSMLLTEQPSAGPDKT